MLMYTNAERVMRLAALAPSRVCVATPWRTRTDTLWSPGNTFPGAVVGDMRVERSERSRRREQRERETESKRLPRAAISAARGATTTRYRVVCWEILRMPFSSTAQRAHKNASMQPAATT